MRHTILLPLALFLFSSAFSVFSEAEDAAGILSTDPKVIYGEDDRLDYYQVEDPALRMLADSTAVMVPASGLSDTGSGFRFTSTEILGDNNVCPEEPFYHQPSPGFCSAFLVSPDLVVTAGHCANSLTVRNIAFVFGFRMVDEDTPITTFEYEEVYFGAELVARQGSTCSNDWSLIRLDRPVESRPPLAVRKAGRISDNQSLVVIGHPLGLPVKISGGASVRSNVGFRTFVANLDTYQGNSGSAVFNADTLEVEGVLVCGEADFVTDSQRGCRVSNRCSDSGCRGEDCTRATEWSHLLPDDPCAGTGEISIAFPQAGETHFRGKTLNVEWGSRGQVGDKLEILLFSGDYFAGWRWTDIPNLCAEGNVASVTLPSNLPEGSSYRFRLHNGASGDAFVAAFSDYFSIARDPDEVVPKIDLQAPVKFELAQVGTLKEIRWISEEGAGGQVRILLFRGEPEDLKWQFVDLRTENSAGENSYLWTVPLGLEPAKDYRLRILSDSLPTSDLSDPFEVVEPAGVEVTSPDALTRGVVGEELEVRWTSQPEVVGPVEILVFAGKAPVWQGVRISGIPNQPGLNSYRWRIPETWLNRVVPNTPFYSVKVFQTDAKSDYSELFSIDRAPTSLRVVEPAAGTLWKPGEIRQVRWESIGQARGQLQLLLFRGTGADLRWQFVAETIPNNPGPNLYAWTIPGNLLEGADYSIKIHDPSDPSLFAFSSLFTLSPNGKGNWGVKELIGYLEERRTEKRTGEESEFDLPLLWNP